MMERQLYSLPEAAELLGLSRRSIEHLTNDGRVASTRIGHRVLITRATILDIASNGIPGRIRPGKG